MHLLIPFAAPLAEAGRKAAATLALPRLQALMKHLRGVQRDDADAGTRSPPHERALAQALGWQAPDGRLPWAAWLAGADGLETGDRAWGLVTPAHWHLGSDQVTLLDPASLRLDDAGSRALFTAVRGLFGDDGWALHYGAPLRWYANHESLAALATASPDRVIGRNVDAWLGLDAAARRIRRLQSEVQMLLHTHPINERREAAGLLPVNSFWLSGCGVARPASVAPAPQPDDRLRGPALAGDWAAWTQSWQTLDAGPLATLLTRAEGSMPLRLTLCGERAWAAFEPAERGWAQRLRARWHSAPVLPLLESL